MIYKKKIFLVESVKELYDGVSNDSRQPGDSAGWLIIFHE